MKYLVTGGAGFIGSKLVTALVEMGAEVVVIDNFNYQIHGEVKADSGIFKFLRENTQLHSCDMGELSDLSAVSNIDYVFHLASETGTGQSMYEHGKYIAVNVSAFTKILDEVIQNSANLKGVFVAGSRSIYGEGMYLNPDDGSILSGVMVPKRSQKMLQNGEFDLFARGSSGPKLVPIATSESALPEPLSLYASTKLIQENVAANLCSLRNIPVHCLRFQNVYGPGQSLKNPYTGIVSIFLNNIRNGIVSNIFEDGGSKRDFIFVDDLVRILLKCVEINHSFTSNLGSGTATTVLEVYNALAMSFDLESRGLFSVTGDYRVGDIRNNYADMSQFNSIFPDQQFISVADGLKIFVEWAMSQPAELSSYQNSLLEAKKEGVMWSKDQLQ